MTSIFLLLLFEELHNVPEYSINILQMHEPNVEVFAWLPNYLQLYLITHVPPDMSLLLHLHQFPQKFQVPNILYAWGAKHPTVLGELLVWIIFRVGNSFWSVFIKGSTAAPSTISMTLSSEVHFLLQARQLKSKCPESYSLICWKLLST